LIKAVFLDWFHTLAKYEPPREELQSQALGESGIHLSPQQILPGLMLADKGYFEENAISPIRERSPEEQARIFFRYQQTILTEAKVSPPLSPAILEKVMRRLRELHQGMSFALFDDVLPSLKGLQERHLTLGLLTNLDMEMQSICRGLGLEPYLDFIVTSGEVGSDKPNPLIFLAALERAGVRAAEVVHVGDQYQIDVVGARGVGITPVLIDRYNLNPDVSDCVRIASLSELGQYLG